MNKTTIVGIVAGMFVIMCIAFIAVLFLVKVMWAWTIPDLFPGAVEQGLVAASISWLTAIKLALFSAILLGIAGAGKDSD